MIELEALAKLTKPELMNIVNDMKINPVVKSVVLSQIRRADDDKIKSILDQVARMIKTVQAGDGDAINNLVAELKEQAAKNGIPPQYIDGLIQIVKPEIGTNAADKKQ
jgi:hypothetical protein